MPRMYSYLVIGTGLILLFYAAGLPTGVDWFLTFIGVTSALDGSRVAFSTFFLAASAVLASATIGGILVGFFTRASPESFLIAGFSTSLLTVFLGTYASIITYAATNAPSWVAITVALIMLPLNIGFISTVLDYWRGTAS